MTARTRKEYMHPVYGLCVLIHPDPEDGALLIMERRGGDEDDDVRPFYFGCESSELFHVGERVTGRVEQWVGDADEGVIAVAVAPDDTLADPLGNNVPLQDRLFRWEPDDAREKGFERAWVVMDPGMRRVLQGIVRGGIRKGRGGQWRRIH